MSAARIANVVRNSARDAMMHNDRERLYAMIRDIGREPGMLPTTNASVGLDGLPEDIWTIDPAGGAPVRVADLKEDLPALTWSGDGKHV